MNVDIYANTYVGYVPKSQRTAEPNCSWESINTMNPHPLARYSDPSFNGIEYTEGLSFHDHDARRVLTADRHRDLPLLNVKGFTSTMSPIDDGGVFAPIDDTDEIERVRQLFAAPEKSERRRISPLVGTIPGRDVPLIPGRDAEPFSFSMNGGPNGIPQVTMTDKELRDLDLHRELKLTIPPSASQSCDMKQNERFVNKMRDYFTESFAPKPVAASRVVESFDGEDTVTAQIALSNYLEILKTRATAVCFYLQNNKSYSKWSENWKFLESNLKKSRLLFERLDESDADIAYVINKGEEIKFRIHDEKRFIPINIYQYVLYHEMAHLSTHELQHTPKFHELLNIISLAGFELGFIDLTRIQKSFYHTNGQPILCRASLKEEIIEGCNWLIKANPKSKPYYEDVIAHVRRK